MASFGPGGEYSEYDLLESIETAIATLIRRVAKLDAKVTAALSLKPQKTRKTIS